ncbi:TlpA disulfide reductase family protein [Chitinophaga sp. sic0106]|uniref:TlpA disulfide reductase family protein n=1 Tax=Chitinophaga sp. sic0106 TaxID=2854785 RepID=UPI001C43F126|nr:TlpA disulfide reductase family protein [Chitinophaga sp. sic0106]MBV7530248.1 redoxin family protein [Chitinophaga sp. sic0106]
MNKIFALALAGSLVLPGIVFGQKKKDKPEVSAAELKKLAAAVAAHPDSLSFHDEFIKGIGIDNPAVVIQYQKWMKQFPKNANVPYALAAAYLDEESPKAKPYLEKTVALDPQYVEGWGGLWTDAQRWGKFEEGEEYLRKATVADPNNAQYAFYYAEGMRGKDAARHEAMILDVAKRFPDHERGAQALYWLAVRGKGAAYQMKIFELLKNSYDPAKFSWSSSGMSSYYNLLLEENPEKAVTLANEMATKMGEEKQSWEKNQAIAKAVVAAKGFIAAGDGAAALAQLKTVNLPWYSTARDQVLLLKASATALSSKSAAYDSLMVQFLKTPGTKLFAGMLSYGEQLGKSAKEVGNETWSRLQDSSKQATEFSLRNYFTNKPTTVADYKGKVVLLTYWFPGCGPCRGEFPHFENVIRKYKGQPVDYVGINIVSSQNDYVLPFMKGSGYSFTPLEDQEGRNKGNLSNGQAAPVNFLLDQQGRIIFRNFRIDGSNEDQLELMINLVLKHEA